MYNQPNIQHTCLLQQSLQHKLQQCAMTALTTTSTSQCGTVEGAPVQQDSLIATGHAIWMLTEKWAHLLLLLLWLCLLFHIMGPKSW